MGRVGHLVGLDPDEAALDLVGEPQQVVGPPGRVVAAEGLLSEWRGVADLLASAGEQSVHGALQVAVQVEHEVVAAPAQLAHGSVAGHRLRWRLGAAPLQRASFLGASERAISIGVSIVMGVPQN